MIRRFAAVLGVYAMFIIADVLGVVFTATYPETLFANAEFRVISGFITDGVFVCAFSLILRGFKNIKKSKVSSPMFWVAVFVIPISSLYVTLLVLSTDLSQYLIVSVVAVTFGINLLTFYLYDSLSLTHEEKLRATLEAQEKDYYFVQCQMMQESAENIKSLRHDMKHHFHAIRELSIKHDTPEIAKYLNGLLDTVEAGEIHCDTGNLAFDSIINYKFKDVEKKKISLNLDILIPSMINVEIADIATILGNLLDNAITAVENVENKWIDVNISFKKGVLTIAVINSYDGCILLTDESNGTAKTIASKKSGDEHGYGLKNVKKAVLKYDGEIHIVHKNNIFEVSLMLFIAP